MKPFLRRRFALSALAAMAAGVHLAGPSAAQGGLRGDYFDAPTPPAPGAPADFTRVDPTIDFVWTMDAPEGTTIQPDDVYSERWTGWVYVGAAGNWTFYTTSNDGTRLWIDDVLVIDDWSPHFTQETSGTIALSVAGWHRVRLEHYNAGGTAVMRLAFEGPGQPRVVIPAVWLCSNAGCQTSLRVDAGPDRVLEPPETSLTLQGSVRGSPRIISLPAPLELAWTQLSGPPALIQDDDALSTVVTPSEGGILRFELSVFDGVNTAADEVTVYVFGDGQDAQVSGSLRKWHKVSLTFEHDVFLSEVSSPNPFLDLRLDVVFLHAASRSFHVVPGFFAADGDAAESSAWGGRSWRVHFAPERSGKWYYLASFRSGPGVAVAPMADAGQSESFDGAQGSFTVAPADPSAPGLLAKGRLVYVGGHHLRFAETNEPYLKGGADSPENFLGYYEFDGTSDLGGQANNLQNGGYFDGLHHFDPHWGDYVNVGVSTWKVNKGRRILGALSYLASRGVNSLYALTFNTEGGDGREVWPWATPADRLRFDVSKLEQWERVIDHMTRSGLVWQVVTQESENDLVLDDGALGVERKLYYRELVSRFGHALGLVWNLGEENSNPPLQQRAFAEFLRALDPYDHPITVHPDVDDPETTFDPHLGALLETVPLHGSPSATGDDTRQFVSESAAAGRPWAVTYDEQTPVLDGAVPDTVDFTHDSLRKNGLWGNLMAQGAGVEWYFGYGHPHDDLDCEDFRSRDNLWRLTTLALDFFRRFLPFAEMDHADPLGGGGGVRVLARRGEIYAVYLPNGGTTTLDLQSSSATFRVDWFDPRNGGALQPGSVAQVTGPGRQALGSPPAGGDWVAVVRRADNRPPAIESVVVDPQPFLTGDLSIQVVTSDPDAPADRVLVTMEAYLPTGELLGTFVVPFRGGALHALLFRDLPSLPPGQWRLELRAQDSAGATDSTTATFEVQQ